MAAEAGRKVLIKYSADNVTYTAVAGAREAELNINAEPIDITDKSDNGVRQLLDDVGTHSISITCGGVLLDDTLILLMDNPTTGSAIHYFEFEIGSIGDFTGQWFITSFKVEGQDGANPANFSFTAESAGTIIYT
jgi:TP901-1 family phage major tail protein